jgi:iron-sulfur cluster assembly protein
MEQSTSTIVVVTEAAARRARAFAETSGDPKAALRIRVVAGGCSGFSYELSFEHTPKPEDLIVEGHGLQVFIDPRSAPIVEGSTLEFNDALLGGGLKIRNPRAVKECGCGTSFSIDS